MLESAQVAEILEWGRPPEIGQRPALQKLVSPSRNWSAPDSGFAAALQKLVGELPFLPGLHNRKDCSGHVPASHRKLSFLRPALPSQFGAEESATQLGPTRISFATRTQKAPGDAQKAPGVARTQKVFQAFSKAGGTLPSKIKRSPEGHTSFPHSSFTRSSRP